MVKTTTVDTITVLAQTTVVPSTPEISPERRNSSGSDRTLDEMTIPATQFRISDDDDTVPKEPDESSLMAKDVQNLVDALDVSPQTAKEIQNWTSQAKVPRKTRRSSGDVSPPLSSPQDVATPKAIRQFKNQQSAGMTSSSPKGPGSQMSPPKTDRKRKKDHDKDTIAPVPETPKRQTTRALDVAPPNKQRRIQPQRRRLTETPQREKDSMPLENTVQQPPLAPVRKTRIMKVAKKAKAAGF